MINIKPKLEPIALALAGLHTYHNSFEVPSLWSRNPMFRLNHPGRKVFKFYPDGRRDEKDVIEVCITTIAGQNSVEVCLEGSKHMFNNCVLESIDGAKKNFLLDEGRIASSLVYKNNTVHLFLDGNHVKLFTPIVNIAGEATSDGDSALLSPMPCKISNVQVKKGDVVKKGQTLVVVEAMKMEHVIKSPKDGIIKNVAYKLGQLVEQGKKLVEFE